MNSLRTALAHLRKLLGAALLLSDRDTIQLDPTFPLWVDARAFWQMANRGLQMAEPPSAISHLQAASAGDELW